MTSAPRTQSAEQARRERARERRARIVAHRTTSFEDAERWDLEFWQSLTPEERLSALVAIHRDVAAIREGTGTREGSRD